MATNRVSVYTTAAVFERMVAMSAPLNRQDNPPKPGPRHELWRVEPPNGFAGQIVSEAIWGVWTHWDGYRTRECTAKVVDPADEVATAEIGDSSDNESMQAPAMNGTSCRGHAAKWPLRWKGYLHVWNSIAKSYGFLEITPAAAEELLRQAPKTGSLRGLLLVMKRHGTSIRSKIQVQLSAPAGVSDKLPHPQDPEETLRALWGWVTVR